MKVQNLRFCGTPLYRYVEFAGIHSDLFFASEGTASPKLAVRSDDRPARTCWAFGLQELQPSFPPPLGQDPVHPSRLFKAIFPGLAAPAENVSNASLYSPYNRKNQATYAWFLLSFLKKGIFFSCRIPLRSCTAPPAPFRGRP